MGREDEAVEIGGGEGEIGGVGGGGGDEGVHPVVGVEVGEAEGLEVEGGIGLEGVGEISMEFNIVEEAERFWTTYVGQIDFDVRQLFANKSFVDKCMINVRFVCAKKGFRRPDK